MGRRICTQQAPEVERVTRRSPVAAACDWARAFSAARLFSGGLLRSGLLGSGLFRSGLLGGGLFGRSLLLSSLIGCRLFRGGRRFN